MTKPEECALRLLKLCCSPSDNISMGRFLGSSDADGTPYHRLFKKLRKAGKITYRDPLKKDSQVYLR